MSSPPRPMPVSTSSERSTSSVSLMTRPRMPTRGAGSGDLPLPRPWVPSTERSSRASVGSCGWPSGPTPASFWTTNHRPLLLRAPPPRRHRPPSQPQGPAKLPTTSEVRPRDSSASSPHGWYCWITSGRRTRYSPPSDSSTASTPIGASPPPRRRRRASWNSASAPSSARAGRSFSRTAPMPERPTPPSCWPGSAGSASTTWPAVGMGTSTPPSSPPRWPARTLTMPSTAPPSSPTPPLRPATVRARAGGTNRPSSFRT
mmetsp:Transcript_5175/g.12275  ORF Transcript_5175/g.12275 Transcript_5175/m.12275 type:complete len:259 (-) Transcript_5175:247-1023(-)